MIRPRLHHAGLATAIGAALFIGACTRSASTPPPSGPLTGTPSGLTAQRATMDAVRSVLESQTAQAATGLPAGESTPTPEQPTAAPTSVVVGGETQAPGTPTTEAPPTASSNVPSNYTLQEGEHPYCIARRFDVHPETLLSANGLDKDSLHQPGMTLVIPRDTSGFPPPRALRSHPATYTAQPGDTIYIIACLYGDVDPMAIARANNLTEPYNLTPGTVLNIP